jgi:hypothetical protein
VASEYDEAREVAFQIKKLRSSGESDLKETAVLYRTKFQVNSSVPAANFESADILKAGNSCVKTLHAAVHRVVGIIKLINGVRGNSCVKALYAAAHQVVGGNEFGSEQKLKQFVERV